jgi:hypothetical protein
MMLTGFYKIPPVDIKMYIYHIWYPMNANNTGLFSSESAPLVLKVGLS